jgi:monoamine oxidase
MEHLLKAAHFHDWQADPYSLGAYSYMKAGAVKSPEILGSPLEEILFFAAEARDTSETTILCAALSPAPNAQSPG